MVARGEVWEGDGCGTEKGDQEYTSPGKIKNDHVFSAEVNL